MSTQSNFRTKFLIGIAVAIFLSLWVGVPMFKKWQADKLVDQLCAKDGGIIIYETVKLPADRFSKFGEIYVPKRGATLTREYYYTSDTQWIIPEAIKFGNLDLRRVNIKLYRAIDGKLLAESIGYSRRGGEVYFLPSHPSHYNCSFKYGIKNVSKSVFIHN